MTTRNRRGFTLIELLVVIALSAVILTIIAVPLIQSFNITRAAQGFSDAQNRGRALIDRVTRDINNSTGVRDNSGTRGQLCLVIPSDPDFNGIVDGQLELLFGGLKLDILMPAQGDPTVGPSGALIDPDTGKEDPTLRAPKGQPVLPVGQGARMVRYFVGLRSPLNANGTPGVYTNPYDGFLMRRSGSQDNLYVLYRADVDVRVWNAATQSWILNSDLFDDADTNGQPDNLDDPYFFVLRAAEVGTPAEAVKRNRINAWLKRSVVVTEISRYDMIQPVVNRATNRVEYDGVTPRILPLIQFRPSRVASEPATGMVALRSGEETQNSPKIASDVFSTEFGGWSNLLMRIFPSQYRVGGNPATPWNPYQPWLQDSPYLVGRNILDAGGNAVGFGLYYNDGTAPEATGGDMLFDISAYQQAQSIDRRSASFTGMLRYPFTYAIMQAGGGTWQSNATLREAFIPVSVDERRGRVNASFEITEVGGLTPPPGYVQPGVIPTGMDNRPWAATGLAITPTQAANLTNPGQINTDGMAGVWSDVGFNPSEPNSTINRRFNKLWNDWNGIAPGLPRERYAKRFVDLRFVRNLDGTASPLHPTEGFPRARIVPGSEIVMGPDQNPGTNYGQLVRYTRVAQRPVGPNQYYINYVHQREPDWVALGFTVPANIYDPVAYDATDFVSAILQPQFRTGYLEFNSRFGEPIPQGNIWVSYRFQMTEPNDAVAVDYDTRQVLQINVTIRNYPQTNQPNPQTVTITGSGTVRNFIR